MSGAGRSDAIDPTGHRPDHCAHVVFLQHHIKFDLEPENGRRRGLRLKVTFWRTAEVAPDRYLIRDAQRIIEAIATLVRMHTA